MGCQRLLQDSGMLLTCIVCICCIYIYNIYICTYTRTMYHNSTSYGLNTFNLIVNVLHKYVDIYTIEHIEHIEHIHHRSSNLQPWFPVDQATIGCHVQGFSAPLNIFLFQVRSPELKRSKFLCQTVQLPAHHMSWWITWISDSFRSFRS